MGLLIAKHVLRMLHGLLTARHFPCMAHGVFAWLTHRMCFPGLHAIICYVHGTRHATWLTHRREGRQAKKIRVNHDWSARPPVCLGARHLSQEFKHIPVPLVAPLFNHQPLPRPRHAREPSGRAHLARAHGELLHVRVERGHCRDARVSCGLWRVVEVHVRAPALGQRGQHGREPLCVGEVGGAVVKGDCGTVLEPQALQQLRHRGADVSHHDCTNIEMPAEHALGLLL